MKNKIFEVFVCMLLIGTFFVVTPDITSLINQDAKQNVMAQAQPNLLPRLTKLSSSLENRLNLASEVNEGKKFVGCFIGPGDDDGSGRYYDDLIIVERFPHRLEEGSLQGIPGNFFRR